MPDARRTLSQQAAQRLLQRLHTLSPAERRELLDDLDAAEHLEHTRRGREDFLYFCRYVYDGFKEGPHHRFLAPVLRKIKDGIETRTTVSMPPRFGKSETIAFLFVAWYFGHNPKHQVMMATHTQSLSAGFGRKVRDLIDSPRYQEFFETRVSKDKTASDEWTTTAGGKYLAIGTGANVAGHGADLLIADDVVSEQAVLANPDAAFETAWTYMQVGPLQRLMPGGRIIMIGTRWGKRDPIGRALAWAQDNPGAPAWHEIRFPAILPSGRSLWPEQWPVEQLLAKKASMQTQYWKAQYDQEPTSEEGAIVKRDWWRVWTRDKPPSVDYIIQSWDTAHETKNHSDYSAASTWGVFMNSTTRRHEIILLDAFKERMEFPALKKRAKAYYDAWEPDSLIVEKKAAGAPLIQELRAMGLSVEEFSPSRGKAGVASDKRARLNAVSSYFEDGMVWAPDRLWANELINECAEFPNGEHDDYVDVTSLAMMRFRRAGYISLSSDAQDELEERPRIVEPYY